MPSRLKKSPSSKAPEIPLPHSKPGDPPSPRIPSDPRTWHPCLRRLRARKYFLRPQSPWTDDHGLAPEIVAACVVREVMLALDLTRFPAKCWADWLTRRAHALYRIDRQFRRRLNGADERAWCYIYMRHWLYIGLRKSGWKHADLLPEEMHAGHQPKRESLTVWKRGRRTGTAI
jgi:hypothetical protein